MSTTANKVTNPMKVITGPDTRWSYANVWEPKSINGGAAKYSVSLITVSYTHLKAAAEALSLGKYCHSHSGRGCVCICVHIVWR